MNKGFSKKIHRSPMIEKNYRLAPKIPKMKNARCYEKRKTKIRYEIDVSKIRQISIAI